MNASELNKLDDLFEVTEGLWFEVQSYYEEMASCVEEELDFTQEKIDVIDAIRDLIFHLNIVLTEIEMKDTDEVPF